MLVLSLIVTIQDNERHHRKENFTCCITASEILRVQQDILRRMDTSCHMRSTCDLAWDGVLTHQSILQPEGGQVLNPKIAQPTNPGDNTLYKTLKHHCGTDNFLGSREKQKRCFFSCVKPPVSIMYCLRASSCKDKELMYWAAQQHLPSTPKQVIKSFIKITLLQAH